MAYRWSRDVNKAKAKIIKKDRHRDRNQRDDQQLKNERKHKLFEEMKNKLRKGNKCAGY